jgi:lysophospholipase L1-like esterase
LVGLGSAVFGVLVGEAWLARRAIGPATEAPLLSDGRYLPPTPEGGTSDDSPDPLRLALLGDSGAAGFGVERAEQTTGAFLAAGLAARTGRPVDLRCLAVVGAQTADLSPQIAAVLPWQPHLAAIVVGANDVTHAVTPGRSVGLLGAAVRRLRQAGVHVVVGTCPDLGSVRPIPHPLKLLARTWSRSLAAAQMVEVAQSGGRAVALADLLGAGFYEQPEVYFGPDRFHPSVEGYRAVAEVMVPSLVEALGLGLAEPPARPPAPVLELADAAAEASDVAGAEVTQARDSGRRRGRWAALRLRPRVTGPQDPTREAGPVCPGPSQLQP